MFKVRKTLVQADKYILEETIKDIESELDDFGQDRYRTSTHYSGNNLDEKTVKVEIMSELNAFIPCCNLIIALMGANERYALGDTVDKYINTLQQYESQIRRFTPEFEGFKFKR